MPLVEISPDLLEKIAAKVAAFADTLPPLSVERKMVVDTLLRNEEMVALFIDLALSNDESPSRGFKSAD